jgi:pyruvate,water dikinase
MDRNEATESEGAILWLGSPLARGEELVGGKAAALARLTALGYDVPDGFCVTARALSEGAELYGQMLLEAAKRLDPPWVARSSATVEDSPDHLFPGLFASFLGFSEGEKLLRVVAELAAGSDSPAVVAYAERVGIDPGAIRMAAIVQTLVPATAAGVAFTRHPITGEQQVLVEANHGLGETVVDGSIDPDRISVATGQVTDRHVGSKQVKAEVDSGEVRRSSTTERERLTPAISDAQAIEVAATAEAAEGDLGYPVDLEWAVVGERLYVLQARPVRLQAGA